MTQATHYRRRNYFIDKGFQSRFIFKFCLTVLAAGLLTMGLLYFFALRSTTVSIVDSRVKVYSTADFLLPVLIQTVVIVTILISIVTIILTLLVSHKIAGPLYRFKKVIEAMGEGDFAQDFKIRQRDQLQDLAKTINSAIQRVRSQLNLIKTYHNSLKEKLNVLTDDDSQEHRRIVTVELKRLFEELNKIIQSFKS